MLAQALNDCLTASKNAGTPLTMTTFIVGRNRLENEGAFALSEFFKVCLLKPIHFALIIIFVLNVGCWYLGGSSDASKLH